MTSSSQPILSKIGILGDIHAETHNLSIALSHLVGLSLQAVLCVGDIVDGQGNVDACHELLQKHNVLAVRGNHDNWFLADQMRDLPDATLPAHLSFESHEYFQHLPATREFQTNAGGLLLCHGIGNKDMGRITPDDSGYALEMNFELRELVDANRYRFMVNGHTHRRMVRTFGNLTVINAGSLKQAHSPCFLTVDFEAGMVQSYSINMFGEVETGETIFFKDVKREKLTRAI